eukprot:Em0001g252a
MRIQHFLDVASAPEEIAPLLAGGSLTALEHNIGMFGQLLWERLASKCACSVVKEKASDFLSPFQFGVACPSGSEKIIHNLREVLEQHWSDPDFAVIKIDMQNAFNLVSRDVVLLNQQCFLHFPEIYPWTCWCYSQHPKRWHPVGLISSASGVQQGDPLGLLLFALVRQSILRQLAADLTHNVNNSCLMHDEMKQSNVPHFEILGAPIGDLVFCATFVAQKQSEASKLLQQLEAVGSIDPQVALLLLRQSYIASFQSSGLSPSSGKYLSSSVDLYNSLVDPQDSLTLESVGNSHLSQKVLSSKIEDRQFGNLFHATLTDRAHLLSVSSPHTSAWLSVTPSPRLNLHLEPAEFQVALKWWLGIPVVQGQVALTVLPLCWMTLAITPSVTSANVLAWVYVWRWAVGLGSPIHNPALQMFLSLTGTLLPLTCPSRPATSKCFARTVVAFSKLAGCLSTNPSPRPSLEYTAV